VVMPQQTSALPRTVLSDVLVRQLVNGKILVEINPDPSVARDAANQRQQAVSRLDENDQLQRASHTPRDMAAHFHVRSHGYGREWTEPKSWSAEALTQNDERRRNIGYR